MGIFSLFGKKDRQQVKSSADKNTSSKKRDEACHSPSTKAGGDAKKADSHRHAVKRKVVAHETALKIDAIESEMSSEFGKHTSAGMTLPGPAPRATPAARPPAKAPSAKPVKSKTPASPSAKMDLPTMMGTTTQFLLGSETLNGTLALSSSEASPVIEEAAILFANGQFDMVERLLQSAIQEDMLGDAASTVWHMLFDLYQVTGKQMQFEHLSIEYANKFETSPPGWMTSSIEPQPAKAPSSGATPAVPFVGKLDGNIARQVERVQNLAANNRVLRLEFVRVTEVNPVGCGILLSVLKRLRKSGNDLILVGALELTRKIRAILQVGRRDETETPWLLLLELLCLLNLEAEFEEASIDYCVTFEVSPPAFVAPQNKVTMATPEMSIAKLASDQFIMPPVVEGRADQLVLAIAAFAASHKPAILDCSRLIRVDFGAAGQLLTGLAPFTARGAMIELHNVNHLVIALFHAIGLQDIVRILPRKS